MGNNKFLCIFFYIISIFLGLTKAETKEPTIVIIGAGAAGIAAATKLLDYGFKDLTILEAEPRIGGRIKTLPFADNVVDLGAQWLHGDEKNPIYEMVKDLDLLDVPLGIAENATVVRSNGEAIDENTIRRLSIILGTLQINQSTYENEDENELNYFKTGMEKELETDDNKDIDKATAIEYVETFAKGVSSFTGADNMAELPARYDSDTESIEGYTSQGWKDKGYKQFLNVLLKSKETGKEFGILEDHIKISKPVKYINWQRDDSKVLIECEDGEKILADHVIVTVSLGVLKAKQQEMFVPELPASKRKAIEAIEYGTANKMFFEFEKPFWPETWSGFMILWRQQELQEIRGTDKAWLEGIFTFHLLRHQPRVLQGWLISSFGRQAETLGDEVVKNEVLTLLQHHLPWSITPVANFKISDWFTNPHFRGTNSYDSLKTKAAGVKRIDLEKPLFIGKSENCQRPVVQFAGEATYTKHSSFVQSAIKSGWREAKRLADFYGKSV